MNKTQIIIALPPADTVNMINENLYSQFVHQESHDFGEDSVHILIYEQYYFRAESYAGLTIIIRGNKNGSVVTAVSSASGKGMLDIDWGASANYANSIIKILKPYEKE